MDVDVDVVVEDVASCSCSFADLEDVGRLLISVLDLLVVVSS